MRVLHITPMYPTESNPGFGAFVKSQIESLKEHVDLDLLELPGIGGMMPYLKSIPIIKKKLQEEVDIVHVHFGHMSTLVKIVRKSHTPLVTSYCGSDLLGKVSGSWAERTKGKYLSNVNVKYAKFDDCSIVKSKQLSERLDGSARRIEIIPNGIDTTVFKQMDKDACRAKLGLDLDRPVLLFPADPENEVKNFNLLKIALRDLEDLNIQVMSFGKDSRVPHNEVATCMNAADLVVLTSIHEGSSNVVKEAMACNRPVISTRVGDSEWLLEGVEGSNITDYNSTQLAGLIKSCIVNKGTLSNARAMLFDKKLDAQSTSGKIIRIYNDLLNITHG